MTRLLLKLRAIENTRYDREYHKDIQGFVYSVLRGSEYNNHDDRGYKFFTFSEIFPFYDLHKGDIRNLMIASPNSDLINYIKEQIEYLHDIRLGAMTFKVDHCDKLDIRLPDRPFSLITGSPIVMRVQRYRFEEANALQFANGHKSSYWKVDHPVELFMNQLEANLVKKYNRYHNIDAVKMNGSEREPIFYQSRFLKQVAIQVPVTANYRETVIGSKWLFRFAGSSDLVRFALDVGLGESNSLGFGFMNVQREVYN